MEKLLKDTELRIEELGKLIEEGQQVANELEYTIRRQRIANDVWINEKNMLTDLLEEQNQPKLEKMGRGY